MARIGVFTDPHGKDNIRAIAQVLEQEKVDQTLCLGDILYRTQTELTNTAAQQAVQMRSLMQQDSPLRKAVLEGLFTDEQLKETMQGYQDAREINDKIATAEYADMDAVFKNTLLTLGGNWDRTVIEQAFGDRYLNGKSVETSGLKILGCSGGGSQPTMAFGEGLLADDHEKEIFQHQKWRKPLLLEERIDVLATHVPPTDGEGIKKENAVEHLKNLLLERNASGKTAPGVILSGHRHGATIVEYSEELDTWWVQPGVSGDHHNYGPHASFIIVEIDDTTKKLHKVQEYRIYNSVQGMLDVELFGEHILNHDTKKSRFNLLQKTILKEYAPEKFAEHLTLDKNHALYARGMRVNYDALSSPEEKDKLLRENLALISNSADEAAWDIKRVIDTARNAMLADRALDQKVTIEEIDRAARKAYLLISDKAAETFGMNLERVENEITRDFFRGLATHTAYGFTFTDMEKAMKSENKKSTVGKFAHDWGYALMNQAKEHINQQYQQLVLQKIKAEDFQAMAELYLPKNLKRTREMDEREALRLYAAAFQQGLLTPDIALKTGAYETKEDFTALKRTKQDIAEIFSLKTNDLEKKGTPKQGKEVDTSVFPPEVKRNLKEGITSGKIPVFTEAEGDYLLGPQGQKIHLDDELKEGISYTPRSMEQMIGEGIKQGKIPVIEKNGKTYLAGEGGLEEFNPTEYGLTNGDYNALSEQNFNRMGLERNITQREKELDELRERLKQEQRVIVPGQQQKASPHSGLVLPNMEDIGRYGHRDSLSSKSLTDNQKPSSLLK